MDSNSVLVISKYKILDIIELFLYFNMNFKDDFKIGKCNLQREIKLRFNDLTLGCFVGTNLKAIRTIVWKTLNLFNLNNLFNVK